MKMRHARLALLAVVACGAAAWWSFRSPSPDAQPPTPSSASAAVQTAPGPASSLASPPGTDDIPDAEREQMAAMFAAEPALIDALEDATGATDPAVREDAENFLNELDLPTPNPEVAAE